MQEQLKQIERLLTDAVNYNVAIHAAMVSTDNYVTTKLIVNGVEQEVTIPTYHYLLKLIDSLSAKVNSMQIDDDGNDVVQLLSTSNSIRLLYLRKEQQYVNPPLNAKIMKFDTETVPTLYSSASKTSMFVDMSECKLPMDCNAIIAKLDDEEPMYLQIQNQSTSFDKLATILQLNEDGSYIIDSNDFQVNDEVQINSTLYRITFVDGNRIKLELLDTTVVKEIFEGDAETPGSVIYSITKHENSIVEIPVSKIHSKLYLAVQYMNLRSVYAEYDLSFMATAKHQTLEVSLTTILDGSNVQSTLSGANLAFKALPENIDEIKVASKPVINRITHKQTNSHQFVNSALETLMKNNAILEQAKKDIERLQEMITTETAYLLEVGSNPAESSEIKTYNEELSSAKQRYYEAQRQISKLSVSIQTTNPEYVATVYLSSIDSNELPVVQYIVRYQRLSYNVQDVTNDWTYLYGDKRSADDEGIIRHPIDDYSTIDNIQIPIHAYEQVAFQVAAVLRYGSPLLTTLSEWTDVTFTKLPDELLKNASIEQMFQNAYAAQLYSNLQQALEAAGVTKHINILEAFAHKAQNIEFQDGVSLFEYLSGINNRINSLESFTVDSDTIQIYVRYNGTTYPISDRQELLLTASKSYYDSVIDETNVSESLGNIAEEQFEILIVNTGTKSVTYHSLVPGDAGQVVQNVSFADIPVFIGTTEVKPTLQVCGLNHYRSNSNSANNRNIVSTTFDKRGWELNKYTSDSEFNDFGNFKHPEGSVEQNVFFGLAINQNNEVINADNPLYVGTADYDGIGIHAGYKGITADVLTAYQNNAELLENEALELMRSVPYNLLKQDFVQPGYITFNNSGVIDDKAAPYYINRFESYHKYTSGKHSRGAFIFIQESEINNLLLPSYGTSNAIQIDPGMSNAMTIHGVFQTRMTDRLGITDTNSTVQIKDGITLNPTDANFAYRKTMNVNMQIGIKRISFDITFEQNMY